jgi:putative methyltransferase (TIGR04325 family)
MSTRDLLRVLTPPLIAGALQRRSKDRLRFTTAPRNWSDALTQSTGYSDEAILQRVIEASREVVAGRAAYERDSILFAEAAVPFQLVAGILRSAAMDRGRVRVVDIGGSLGSTYRQCRSFLSTLESLEWHIVEQAKFVDAGKKEFSTPELQFHAAIDDVPSEGTPSTFLLSSSLQYIERPYELLSSLTTMPARHLVIDRTPISEAANDRLSIQQAPRAIRVGSSRGSS